jgi:hypothetical protein
MNGWYVAMTTVAVSDIRNPEMFYVLTCHIANWNIYGMVIQVSITLLNIISHFAHSVLENALPQDGLPPFDPGKLVDSE